MMLLIFVAEGGLSVSVVCLLVRYLSVPVPVRGVRVRGIIPGN